MATGTAVNCDNAIPQSQDPLGKGSYGVWPGFDNYEASVWGAVYSPIPSAAYNSCIGMTFLNDHGKRYAKGYSFASPLTVSKDAQGLLTYSTQHAGKAWCAFTTLQSGGLMGGDNFILRACLSYYDPLTQGTETPNGWDACKGPRLDSAEIWNWRKEWLWVNSMDHPANHQPRCMLNGAEDETPKNPLAITTAWDVETLPGAFDDAFVELIQWQEAQNTWFAFDMPDLHNYSLTWTDLPNPHPPHTMQLMGAHALDDGCPTGSLGLTFPSYDVHSAVSVENIFGQTNLANVSEAELKTAIHEIGHNVRGWGENGSCEVPNQANDVMSQGFCFSGNPPHWFNLTHIRDMRENLNK